MCRFVFYLGPSLRLSTLITEPEHSLIRQSFKSAERSEPLNGDGFGVAWYPPPPLEGPGLFRSVRPAWNNANLVSLARVTQSDCILAHVRAASQGALSEANCHPFVAGRYAFMHNGDLGGFPRVRRRLLGELSDEGFALVRGQTDSEHLFALLLDALGGPHVEATVETLAEATCAMMRKALELSRLGGEGAVSTLNLAFSDGRSGIVTRFTTHADHAGESLYLHDGLQYVYEGGKCRMVEPDTQGGAVIVSSERLSSDPGWEALPRNHLLLIRSDRSTELRPLAL